MNLFEPDRRALVGALVGAVTTVAGTFIAGPQAEQVPYSVLFVVAITLVGLLLGPPAAAWAYFATLAVLAVGALVPGRALDLDGPELVRLGIFLVGAPLIVILLSRLEERRVAAAQTLATSHAAEREAGAQRDRGEAERRELDEALATAERERRRLEEVAEAIPEPLVVYDDQLRGTYGNRAALRTFGRSFVERELDEWGRAAAPRDEHGAPLERENWPQVRGQREAFRSRMTLRVPMTGRDLIVAAEGTPIPGGGAVLLLRDVGREEDERRRLSRFASFVAHELRNPLAVAKARIELAQRDPKLSHRAAGHAVRAQESVDAAIGILERLELYSRADSGRVEARREQFPLAPAFDAAMERLRARGCERDVRIEMPAEVTVFGDRHLSEQAITNLLTNADRYSTPGAPIHVGVEEDDLVTLRVRDEGPGVDEDVADRLFRDRVASGRGLGLGLYLVQATMAAMGGTVELEQRAPQAVFALRWARTAEQADAREASGSGA